MYVFPFQTKLSQAVIFEKEVSELFIVKLSTAVLSHPLTFVKIDEISKTKCCNETYYEK